MGNVGKTVFLYSVIAARLGHASIKTTMETYLVITPELQRKFVENVLR
jgi:integrase